MKRLLVMIMVSFLSFRLMAQEYSQVFVVGSAFDCGWDAGKAYLMEKEENGVFIWTGPMKRNDFKFLLKTNPSDVWIDCLNAKVENERIVIGKAHDLVHVENSRLTGGDYKFIMDEEGTFKITVDTKKMTLTITEDDLISASRIDGKGKRVVNIYSCSGKATGDESAYKLLLAKDEIGTNKKNKWAYKGDNPWVIFSLPAIYSINKFGFRDGKTLETGSDVYNIPEYKLYVSTTGVAEADWTEVIHETNVGGQNVKLKKIAPVEARYIKFVPVKNSKDAYIRIYGADIYGTYVRSFNNDIVSTGKTIVDYSNCWGNRETPANMLDGNSIPTEGEDANNSWTFGQSANSGWVIIDLEDEYEVNKFRLMDSEDWITGCKLYTANFVGTGEEWKLIFDGTFDKTQALKEGVIGKTDKPVSGRFLKLEIPAEHQHGLTRIREFEVYGKLTSKPEIITNHSELKKAYELALWTVNLNTTQGGILNAGARYNGNWTRDLAINVWNGFPFLQPEIAKHSLLSLLENNTPEQFIGAEYWDKIIWVKGAYMYYLMTGDKKFLEQALKSGINTMNQLENMKRDGYPVFDSKYGLFTGPSVFNDGIAGYDAPVWAGDDLGGAVVSHPAHKQIKCLSTNCIYYEAYRLLAKIAETLDDTILIPDLEEKATNLKTSIRTYLFNEKTGKLNYLIDQNGNAHPHQEGLGMSFAILFDIVTKEEARKIVDETFVTQYGIPSISPHFQRFSDDKPGRHNMMIWPFVSAFWADACVKTGAYDNFKFELFNLANLGLNKGGNDFWEIYDPKNGAPDGGWQGYHWGGLQHQTWSATGFLNMVWYGLAGIQLEEDKIVFKPFLPAEVANLELTQLKYGNMILNIKLEGEGTKIKEFRLNGEVVANPEILRTLSGEQKVHIILEKDVQVGISQTITGTDLFTVSSKEGTVVIQLKSDFRADSVMLFDMTGKMLESKKQMSGVGSIGANLSKGIYTLKLKCNGDVYSRKIFVS